MAEAASDFDALERLRRLTFTDRVPSPHSSGSGRRARREPPPGRAWKTKYDSDDREPRREFYDPGPASARSLRPDDRLLHGGVLTLASRGVEGLVRNGGRMRLVVGCTLGPAEVDAIARGEDLAPASSRPRRRCRSRPSRMRSPLELAELDGGPRISSTSRSRSRDARPPSASASTVGLPREGGRRRGQDRRSAGLQRQHQRDARRLGRQLGELPRLHDLGRAALGCRRSRTRASSASGTDKAKHCLVIDVPTAVREDLLRFLPEETRRRDRLKRDPRSAARAGRPEWWPRRPHPTSAGIFGPWSGASSGTLRRWPAAASASGRRPRASCRGRTRSARSTGCYGTGRRGC